MEINQKVQLKSSSIPKFFRERNHYRVILYGSQELNIDCNQNINYQKKEQNLFYRPYKNKTSIEKKHHEIKSINILGKKAATDQELSIKISEPLFIPIQNFWNDRKPSDEFLFYNDNKSEGHLNEIKTLKKNTSRLKGKYAVKTIKQREGDGTSDIDLLKNDFEKCFQKNKEKNNNLFKNISTSTTILNSKAPVDKGNFEDKIHNFQKRCNTVISIASKPSITDNELDLKKQNTKKNSISSENSRLKKALSMISIHTDLHKLLKPTKKKFSKSTKQLAAICIQKWFRGYIIRKRLRYLKDTVRNMGYDWKHFIQRYRFVINRIQILRGKQICQFEFDIDEAVDFIRNENRFGRVFDNLAYGNVLEESDLEKFFRLCELHPNQNEINEAKQAITKFRKIRLGQSFDKNAALETIYYIYSPQATKLPSTRISTWINPIVNNEDSMKLKESNSIEKVFFFKSWNLVTKK